MDPKQIAVLISEDIHINNGLLFEIMKKPVEPLGPSAEPEEWEYSAKKPMEPDGDKCPVCGSLDRWEWYDICGQCKWEHDEFLVAGYKQKPGLEPSPPQWSYHENEPSGPNHDITITQAKKNYAETGNCERTSW